MKLRRALVVYRKSLYQIYVREHHDPAISRALEQSDPIAGRLVTSHEVQQAALQGVLDALRRHGVDVTTRWRGRFRTTDGYDLIIALGGDGTVLDTAHRLSNGPPLMGINSDPRGSVGHLCAGTAEGLPMLLDAISSGKLRPERRVRMRVRVDGETVLGPCLNDVLMAHRSPAEMSRLQLGIVSAAGADTVRTDDTNIRWLLARSSGLWISTATGSTAVMRSAGGTVMPSTSQRLQYLLREPYVPPDQRHPDEARGFVGRAEALVVVNRMRVGKIWGDGPHRRFALNYGQVVVIDRHPLPLRLFSSPTASR